MVWQQHVYLFTFTSLNTNTPHNEPIIPGPVVIIGKLTASLRKLFAMNQPMSAAAHIAPDAIAGRITCG